MYVRDRDREAAQGRTPGPPGKLPDIREFCEGRARGSRSRSADIGPCWRALLDPGRRDCHGSFGGDLRDRLGPQIGTDVRLEDRGALVVFLREVDLVPHPGLGERRVLELHRSAQGPCLSSDQAPKLDLDRLTVNLRRREDVGGCRDRTRAGIPLNDVGDCRMTGTLSEAPDVEAYASLDGFALQTFAHLLDRIEDRTIPVLDNSDVGHSKISAPRDLPATPRTHNPSRFFTPLERRAPPKAIHGWAGRILSEAPGLPGATHRTFLS